MVYIEFFRDTPMIVQGMVIYYSLRQVGVGIDPIWTGIPHPTYTAQYHQGKINCGFCGFCLLWLFVALPKGVAD